MKHLALIVTVAFGILLGTAPSARALSLTLNATGTITSPASPFALNDPFSLMIQFETTAADVYPGIPDYGLFPAITALSFSSGAFTATATGGNVLVNAQNHYVLFLTSAAENLIGGSVGGKLLGTLRVNFGGLTLTSDTLASLTTDLLMQMPDKSVSLEGCAAFSGDASSSSCGSPAQALGTISSASIEASAVPEPGSMLLLGTGVSVLAARRRRRKA